MDALGFNLTCLPNKVPRTTARGPARRWPEARHGSPASGEPPEKSTLALVRVALLGGARDDSYPMGYKYTHTAHSGAENVDMCYFGLFGAPGYAPHVEPYLQP